MNFRFSKNELEWIYLFSNKYNISIDFLKTLLLIEDKRFLRHKGIDWIGILRAFIINMKNLGIKQGASTLSQQNYVITKKFLNDRTLKFKIIKIINAKKYEKIFTKEEILKIYLDKIYFGKNYYGINVASYNYFGVYPSRLNKAQSFFLSEKISLPNKFRKERVIKIINRKDFDNYFSINDLQEIEFIYSKLFNINELIFEKENNNDRRFYKYRRF